MNHAMTIDLQLWAKIVKCQNFEYYVYQTAPLEKLPPGELLFIHEK